MTVDIDPLVDFACKTLFGSPSHPSITLHFLNAVLEGTPYVTEVEILNPIVEKEFDEDKYSILDIRAQDADGRRFNIEIQRTVPAGLRERLAYYASTQLIDQIRLGASYTELMPSIGICLLDAVMFREIPDVQLDFRLMNPKHRLTLTDRLQIHLLQLPKYKVPTDNAVIENPIEQWCYFLRRVNQVPTEELLRHLPHPIFQEAIEVLTMISRDPEQRSMYEDRVKMERDVRATIEYAMEQGKEEGRQEGKQQGVVLGKVQLLRQLLCLDQPTDEELSALSFEQLSNLEVDFQQQLRQRG